MELNKPPDEQTFGNLQLIDKLASKRFSKRSVAEEAALYVLDQLSINDWERVRNFEGKAKFNTFLSAVVCRLLEDFSRKRFGRRIIPGWIRELGNIWIDLYRLLCLERFTFTEAISLAADRNNTSQIKEIERAAERILGEIPYCGEQGNMELEYDETRFAQKLESNPETTVSQQQRSLELDQKHLVMKALLFELLGEQTIMPEVDSMTGNLLNLSISLRPEERLLIRLCYREGLSVTEAGKRIGLNRYQAHGKLRRLYTRIRDLFEEQGLEKELKILLES